jgi:hypothetical protein
VNRIQKLPSAGLPLSVSLLNHRVSITRFKSDLYPLQLETLSRSERRGKLSVYQIVVTLSRFLIGHGRYP